MAILAPFPVLAEPPGPDTSFVESRTLGFRSLDGNTILPFTGREFIGQNGITGFDRPPVNVVHDGYPGMVGTKLRDITYGPREVFVPLFLRSDSSHRGYLSNRDVLDDLFDFGDLDYQAEDGTFDLVANSLRGERTLRCIYTGGGEGTLSRSATGVAYEAIGIKMLCVRSLWYGDQWQTTPIKKPPTATFFGRFPPALSTSFALGSETTVSIPGDMPSWATVDLVGPCDSVTISADGLSISIPDGLDAGETATIVTDPRGRVALFDGAKDWSRVAPSDQYQPLSPGQQTIEFDLENPTTETQAVVSGDTLYRRPW